mgnify:CR=1 FL=1
MSGVAATDAARPLIVFNDDVDVVMLVMRHANETWELVTKAEDEGSELIDTQALTHLACLWYAVNDEADEENRALPVLSSDEPVISTSR